MIWKNCSAHGVVEFQTGWSMHHHQSCTKLLQSIFYEFVERHLRKADMLQMTISVNSVNWKFTPSPSPLHHFPSKGESSFFHWEPSSLCWSSVSAAMGAMSSLKLASGKWHIQECSQGIVLSHGLISKIWGSHQWATMGGFIMGGTEGCTRESCKDLRMPLIMWKSSKFLKERSFEHERHCH